LSPLGPPRTAWSTRSFPPRNEGLPKARLLAGIFRLGAETERREEGPPEFCDPGAHAHRAERGVQEAQPSATTSDCSLSPAPIEGVWVRFRGKVNPEAGAPPQDREGTLRRQRIGGQAPATGGPVAQKVGEGCEGLKARQGPFVFLVSSRHIIAPGQEWPANHQAFAGGPSRRLHLRPGEP